MTTDDDRTALLEVLTTMRSAWQLIEPRLHLVADEVEQLATEIDAALYDHDERQRHAPS